MHNYNFMNNLYFEIKNLECAYHRDRVVLKINELFIPRGEMVFIVGQSGCGKSTILETLGLMNNTMQENSNTTFLFHTPDGKTIDYPTIWRKKDNNDLLSDIRREYFSFIFQQTNLMQNFNIYENIAITKMLQDATEAECKRVTNEILKEVALDEFVVMRNGGWSPDSKVFGKANEASGGQQQRMAFARAMVANYNVLFCDEPTGNLDPDTADMLMNYLHNELKKQGNATAVIVTHDMTLATKYGDRIIKIFKKQRESSRDDYYGYITKDSVFTRENGQWIYQDNCMPPDEVIDKLKKWDK